MTEELTPAEIAAQIHQLYEGLVNIVESTLHNGNNPDVHVLPYAKGYTGVSTFTIGIDGLITGPNREFIQAVEALAPGADYKNELLPDGSSAGWKVHLPFERFRTVPVGRRGRGGAQRYLGGAALPATSSGQAPQSLERVLLLWVVTALLGAVLFLRVRSGVLY